MLECQKRNHFVPAMYCVESSTSLKDGIAFPAVDFWNGVCAVVALIVVSLCLTSPAHAEGSVHVGLNQPFVETNATAPGAATNRDLIVDVQAVGEVINISACGAADTNTLAFVIETPSGTVLPTYTPTATVGKILCANPMTAPITTPYRYTTTQTGKFKVRLINVTAANFNRFDVTVTANSTINPDPTGATGITGRVSSLSWQYATGSFAAASATDANYYALAPGGAPTENYVWQLDLNDLVGNGYSISANNKGVNAPRSGYSTDITGNTAVPQFQVYLNYPTIANPPPAAAPAVTGFRFVDSAGQDFGISPGVTAGTQDSGTFEFTTNVTNATYAIAIDVNKNGIFGDAGDVTLSGNAVNGFNAIPWNGTNNSGVILPLGSYQARAEVRLGEFHFIANDVETSGGTANGLTIYEATSPSTIAPTQVYWDDITILGAAAGGTSNTPLGATSGTAGSYHTWGTFDAGGGGFGNSRLVDTYTFGRKTQASLFVAIVGSDAAMTGANGVVTITPSSRPGDALAVSVTDADLNSLTTIVETMLVSVVNNTTGEAEAVTLTETGPNTGIFTGTMPTGFGTAAGANNNGLLLTQATNSLTVTYNDALTSAGGTAVRTATGAVMGGTAGTASITPTSAPGDTLAISVSDADLNGNPSTIETVIVAVANSATGETENVTLSETGPNTGVFSGSLATVAGATAGTNNDGSINSAAGHLITVTYYDAMAANGGPVIVTATDTVTSFNPIVATSDGVSGVINPPTGIADVINVFGNDLINAIAADSTNAMLSVASGSTVPAQLTFDAATGNVSVNAGATAAAYSFTYQICESINPTNCRTATVSVAVVDPIAPIVLTPDGASGIDGVVGAANVANVFTGDTINGLAATATNAILSVATGFTVPAGLTFDTATGNVSVAVGTAPGSYSFDYQLCEAAYPSNCQTAAVTVTVVANGAVIFATPDSVNGVNGLTGVANVLNAFSGDTVGGAAASPANAILTVASGSSVPAGLTFDPATGDVSLAAGTAPGSYSFNYQICEIAFPANCQVATISVTVAPVAPIVASDDSASGIVGAAGGLAVANAFSGDTIDGMAASSANAILSIASGSSLPAGLSFDTATGNVDVAPATVAGTYGFDYQICEATNPTNCETATISVSVVAAPLMLTGDTANNVNGASGATNVTNVFAGDLVNGIAASVANATLSVASGSTVPTALIFDLASGNVSVAPNTPYGTYSFNYQLCETLNPTNCAIATISVGVEAAALISDADAATNVNGASGASIVANAFAGDTVNGVAASPANTILTVAAGSTVPTVLTFDVATGYVSVLPGTPAGTYSFDYQLCDALNPGNCNIAAITISVDASALVVTADSAANINGASGAANVLNAFAGDMINGDVASASNAILSIASGSALPSALTFDTAAGNVGVNAGTAAGTYSFNYQLCEALNPTNCATATISVIVDASALSAAADTVSNVNGATGAGDVTNAFAGDTVNGVAASTSNAILSIATGSALPSALTFDTTTGYISVASGTPAGTYGFTYQLCEALNPSNCATTSMSVTVGASALVVTGDIIANVNGASGANNLANAFAGDMVNGVAASAANAVLSIASGSTVPAALSFDTATGNLSVAPGTPSGTYSFDYQLCEALNPANCQTATISVTVDASTVVVAADVAANVNGASGASDVANAFAGDAVNGANATPTNAILSVATGSTVPAALIFDVATGNVGVAPGTPAGTYSFDYQLCEALNPTNCRIATISVLVDSSALVVTSDIIANVNGASGAANISSLFAGDSVNGQAANAANAVLSAAAGSVVPSALTFNTLTGNVGVVPGTPAGTYSFDYQLCEALNPLNCLSATITVNVEASALVAIADRAVNVNGASGAATVAYAFAGDTVNGIAASGSNAMLTVAPGSTVPSALTFDIATGIVGVAAGTPAGTYSFDYQLCEALNPGNCTTATITVVVDASAVMVTADAAVNANGASGAANVVNVFTGDLVNGVAAGPPNAILSVAPGSTVPSALTFDTATGNLAVLPGTAAGTYGFDYQLCESLNPTNCRVATTSITVDASALVTSADTVTNVNGASGAANVVNAFAGDSVNGAQASANNAMLSVATGSTVPAVLVFDTATGNVSVGTGTASGTYSFEYQLCEALNPGNCRTAAISVTVDASALVVTADGVANVNGATGAADIASAFAGDIVNGAEAGPLNAVLSVAAGSTVPSALRFDIATGSVSVAPGTPVGTYNFDYQLCEALNSSNCRTATFTVAVDPSALTVGADTALNVNGALGAANVANAFAGDTVNGAAASAGNAILSVAAGSGIPVGLAFNVATGQVSVAPGTSAGTYSFDYQLCEALNPANCRISTISVAVNASPLVASPVLVTGVTGSGGNPNVADVVSTATLNGTSPQVADLVLMVAPGETLAPGIGFDPVTGLASVAPATPAGTYSFDVQICERLNPANCIISTITLTVENAGPQASPDSATVVRGNAVTVDVLANDREPDGDPLTVRNVGAPAHGVVIFNVDGNITYTPVDSYVGTDSFTYEVCDTAGQCVTETVSLIVHPSVSALNGVVYLDQNADRARDAADPRQPNWVVEVVRNGSVVATARTDANGFYQIENLPLGSGYSVIFRHPTTGVAYGRTDGVTLNAGILSVDLDRPIDPSGVIYDSVARTPIEGVRVTMVDANGVVLPVGCFLDGSQQGQLTGSDGRYRIDLVPNGALQCPAAETRYRLMLTGPTDTLPGLSTIILPETGPFDPTGLSAPVSIGDGINAPQGSESTRHYFDFRLGSGDPDIINNHIPLDRANALAQLVVTKTSPKRSASIGELVPYTIIVRNPQAVTRTNVDVVDTMPAGFQYVANSGRVNAAARAPVVRGRELNWRNVIVPANGSVTISVMLTPGAGVRDGDQVNLADSRDALSGRVLSNQGQATVRITPSPLFDCSEIIGRVFDDSNGNGYQDEGELGIAGARVATVNGLLITADQYGRYHIACAAVPNAQMGSNFILKLDPRSLPAGYSLTTENPRVVRVTRGKMVEIDFGVRGLELVTFTLNDDAFAEGSNALTPEWEAKLPALIDQLKTRPSRLWLHYAGDDAAQEKLEKLEKLAAKIAASWKEQGGKQELDVEWTTGPATGADGKGR